MYIYIYIYINIYTYRVCAECVRVIFLRM